MKIHEIDTRHGTANHYSFSHGNCLPYTGVPFGMNYFCPQTKEEERWWFHPEDHTFLGYRLTHQPSPWMADFSQLVLTPYSGNLVENDFEHVKSSYRPEDSIFQPTHLQITQQRYQITSQLIPSMYGGIFTINYQQKQNSFLLHLPGKYFIESTTPYQLKGYVINHHGCEDPDLKFYFSLHFSEPLQTEITKAHGENGFIPCSFGDVVKQTIQLGTSFISLEQAELNLQREIQQTAPDYLVNSQNEWQNYFDRIQVEHQNKQQLSTFYHNLYRTFLFPQTFYEVNQAGEKIHYDTYSQQVRPGILYTNNGFWDTYKTVYPLYSLIAQEKYQEMLAGFLNSYKETGFLPKWLSPDERGLMPGTLIDAVIADAAVKGIGSDLMPEFLEAMKKGATIQSENKNYGRQGTTDYLKYGYVPSQYHESVNHTLDYAYSDFCISQVAKTLGETDDVNYYQKQAGNFRNIFDAETGFMRAKDTEGNFREGFLATRWGKDYAEGSAWQSSFAVYQDFAGLIEAYGSSEIFEQKLIELCNQSPSFNVEGYGSEIHEMSEMAAIEFGQLAISNQPSFHYPYLFSYLGKPEMAQPLIKQLLTQTFDDSINGYPGDEDNGSMAGWYIFNCLGFYPVTPGSGEYVIGMPLLDKVTLKLSNGKDLSIESTPNKPQQQFIHEIKRNGETHHNLFFQHQDLMNGGEINYQLGIVPNSKKYTAEELPFSLSK
ncbi:putative alpha-1,2-mannosidase [Enterococcus sp. PF1-24]|uniref:GH92 family glycosyl hydrolase n=1 Tax=unclassified Enterococcus TaxID=2608891 RepID=UPI002476D5A2|nr:MULTISPECIES: GH92 family glycosyl hydrolase [unclassified Enterococcus]MDH6365182.1 putative alpha-1,2-mannosidase [Enterococcus sp. PFB1-1]MDH6402234.1 putative alpha-1,2-mannosidase [Enterococcus sp. PF1-24]